MLKRLGIVAAIALAAASLIVSSGVAAPAASSVSFIRAGGSTGLQLLATALATAYNKTQSVAKVTVVGGGSGAGITGASNGTFDIGNSSRDPRSSDPSGLVFTKVSREPFVIIVNPANPIKNLTHEQVKAILTGKVKNWSDVSARQVSAASRFSGPITVYGRVSTSGTFASCKKFYTDNLEYRSDAPALGTRPA